MVRKISDMAGHLLDGTLQTYCLFDFFDRFTFLAVEESVSESLHDKGVSSWVYFTGGATQGGE